MQQSQSTAAGEQHADGVVEVVGGDDAALFAALAALLQVGVERHDEEAAGDRRADDSATTDSA